MGSGYIVSDVWRVGASLLAVTQGVPPLAVASGKSRDHGDASRRVSQQAVTLLCITYDVTTTRFSCILQYSVSEIILHLTEAWRTRRKALCALCVSVRGMMY